METWKSTAGANGINDCMYDCAEGRKEMCVRRLEGSSKAEMEQGRGKERKEEGNEGS